MNDMQIFDNPVFGSIRTLDEDGTILFSAKDIATALNYTNPRKAVRDHCKGVTKRSILTNGGMQEVVFIPESDLYRLTFSSKLEKAEEFTDWVTSEVLPSIRKHGAYLTSNTIDNIINNPDFGIKLLTTLKEEQERCKALELENANQKQMLLEAKPKLDYVDQILSCTNAMNITQIAKDYGMGAVKMNQKLHELKIQYKQNNQWLLYDKYANLGYTRSSTSCFEDKNGSPCAVVHTKWTQKGRMFLYEKLKKVGILPMIERDV